MTEEVGFISYAEPAEIKKLFPDWISSQLPEDNGFDFYWPTDFGFGGVQRKRFPDDFMASLHGEDRRLAKEVFQMQESRWRLLVLEGVPQWDGDGNLLNYRGEFSLWQLIRLTWSLLLEHGVFTMWARDSRQMAQVVREYMHWTNKPVHDGLWGRGSNKGVRERGEDGKFRLRRADWVTFMLMGLPQIGKNKAQAICRYAKENLEVGSPVLWNPELLLEDVPGIDKGIAGNLRRIIPGGRVKEKKVRGKRKEGKE